MQLADGYKPSNRLPLLSIRPMMIEAHSCVKQDWPEIPPINPLNQKNEREME